MRFGGLFHGFSFGAGFELMRRVVVPVVLALCILGLWWWLGPEKPSCDSARQHVARSAVEHAVTRMRAEQGDVRRAAVLHLANGPTDFVTPTLRRRLMEGGWLDLDGTPPMEKVRNLLNFRNPSVYDVEKAREYGKENGLDAVIIGNLDQFETTKDSAVLKGLLKFVRIAKGDVVDIPLVVAGGTEAGKAAKPELAPPDDGRFSLTTRVCLLVLCVVAFPIVAFPFLKMAMRRDSNIAAASALIVLVVFDGIIIRAFLGASDSFVSLAVFLVALAAAFGYDMFMLSYAQLCRPPSPAA